MTDVGVDVITVINDSGGSGGAITVSAIDFNM